MTLCQQLKKDNEGTVGRYFIRHVEKTELMQIKRENNMAKRMKPFKILDSMS